MKKFNEWLKEKNLQEGWWPFGSKKEPEHEIEQEPTRPAVAKRSEPAWYDDPKYKLKGNPGSFAECPHCKSLVSSFYDVGSTGQCFRCKKKFWLDDEQQRQARRMVAWDKARRGGSSSYDFEGGRYHTDPKGAAQAERRARDAIRGDLSNI